MPSVRRTLAIFAFLLVAGSALPAGVQAASQRALETSFVSPFDLTGSEAPLAVERMRAAGATSVRIPVEWSSIAPGSIRPQNLKADDPADPRYQFAALDRQVRMTSAAGLAPLLSLYSPPQWATSGGPNTRPDAQEYQLFAKALAQRYSGGFADLPRVRHWQAWNEPNLKAFLGPQSEGGRRTAAGIYRALVNGLAAGVKAVHADNLVVAGGLAPFSFGGDDPEVVTAPLRFMRELLCMEAGSRRRPRPSCAERTRFDVWSTHPYTTGGPTQSAVRPDDVSLGDLPEMRTLLGAAERARRIQTQRRVSFWVTEFSWDTSPPDPGGVPPALHARWVSEALYRMWRSGVSRVTWFLLVDRPHVSGRPFAYEFQSGLYFRRGESLAAARPKPALAAFRFPFVALRVGARTSVWGRVPPPGEGARVVVERRAGSRWVPVASLRANAHGIFERRLGRLPTGTFLRGRVAGARGARSIAFSLTRTPNRRYNPFGGTLG